MRVAGENEFGLQFMSSRMAKLRIGLGKFRSTADDFLLNTAGLVEVLIFKVENGVDPMLATQGPKSVLEPPPRKHGAIPARGLSFEVELGGPLRRNSVFHFHVRREIGPRSRPGNPDCAERLDLQVPWFLHVMVIGHEVRAFLCRRKSGAEQND